MKVLAYVVVVPFLVLFVIAMCLYSGWALTTSWNWLMVPIFGIRALTIYQGMAVSVVISYLTYVHVDYDDYKAKKIIITMLLRPVILVLFSYIIKSYI